MVISELIEALEALRKSRGDLDVLIYDEDNAEDFSTYSVEITYDGDQAVASIAATRA